VRVCESPADQRSHDERTELRDAEQADGQRRVGEEEDLVCRGDDRQLAAEERNELTAVEKPVLPRLA
jgi:hypothetical protein